MSYAYTAVAAVSIMAYQTYSANEQAKKANELQENAMNNATAAAKKQEVIQDQAFNKANAKTPDTSAIMSQAQQAAKGGGSGTMLTGSSGIDPTSLALSKNTLLGV